jgi:hypothetical protein
MIEIIHEFPGENARNSEAGNLNDFLRALVVEVVSENYRQVLFEDLLLKQKHSQQALDPALRRNEEVVSGLFAFALGKVCRFTRSGTKKTKGHVDFHAWYNKRVIAIELKAGYISLSTGKLQEKVVKRWKNATIQATGAQISLRKAAANDHRLQKPISIALMIVAGTSPKKNAEDINKSLYKNNFKKALESFKPRPKFSAIYSIPAERQTPARLRRGALTKEGEQTYIPYYGFLARARVQGKG